MEKGFTKTLYVNQRPIPVYEELRNVHDELVAKKLSLIISWNVYSSDKLKVVELVQIFIDDGNSKRG